jgi:tetratricopeptide (TPR) repeat protein
MFAAIQTHNLSTKVVSENITELLNNATEAEDREDWQTAFETYRQILSLQPKNVRALNSLGSIQYRYRNYARAQQLFEAAINVAPQQPLAWTNLGACHHELKQMKQAIDCYKRATRISPDFATAYMNLGNTYDAVLEFELAVATRLQAFSLDASPTNARSLAKSYRSAGRYDRALALLEKAVLDEPENVHMHFDLATNLLAVEQWQRGFEEYEWRFERKEMQSLKEGFAQILAKPAYNGEDISNATLLLFTEQGYGDNFLFARYVRMIRPMVGRLVMVCRPGLGALFRATLPIDEAVETDQPLPEFDFQLPLLSIPRAFNLTATQFDNLDAYIKVSEPSDPLCSTSGSELKVGIVWSVSDTGYDYRNKKIPLESLKPILESDGVNFYSLQVGDDSKEIDDAKVTDCFGKLPCELTDFAETAEVISKLDLVISVDTSVAHLAGAMGKPVWVLLKKEPYWVWQSDGERSLWYPSARLYRQYSYGDWSDVIRRVSRDLTQLIQQRGS